MPRFDPESLPAAASVQEQTYALQEAVDACAATGGTLLVPSGTRLTLGTIHLRSRVEMSLEPGSLLRASPNGNDFESRGSWGGWNWKYWFLADDCEDVSLTGGGVLDGNGVSYMERETPDHYVPVGGAEHLNRRPLVLAMFACRRTRVRDLTIRDSAHWTLRFVGCNDVAVGGLSILNDLRIPNNDGIDIDHCRDVRISDCHIEAGDDAISLKTVTEYAKYGATENVVVSGCTLRSRSSALVVGCENHSDVRNIIFSGCTIAGSNRGLSVSHRQGGSIENVLFSDMVVRTELQGEIWWGKAEPISVTSLVAPEPWNEGGRLGAVRNVRFRNIQCDSANGIVIQGGLTSRPEDVRLEGVHLRLRQASGGRRAVNDFRPYRHADLPGRYGLPEQHDPSSEGLTIDRGLHGFHLELARNLTLRDCSVELASSELEDFRSPLTVHDVEGLTIHSFRGPAGVVRQMNAAT